MPESSTKPVIFISYSHKDEPEKPEEGERRWLTYVQSFLAPAIKHGIFEVWVDRDIPPGADLDRKIKEQLAICDVFVLLTSRHSLASRYILETEIPTVRARQAAGEEVHICPIVLSPCSKRALKPILDLNLRPRDAKPLSGFDQHDRDTHMAEIADEIAGLVETVAETRTAEAAAAPPVALPGFVDIGHLPDTPYERLVGRDNQLARLDEAWEDSQTNILSLVAEGGAGKSALITEWLTRLRGDDYRGGEVVLGWSFYSQGSKERATSSEQFLDWAMDKLGLSVDSTSAGAKGEAIAAALAQRRALFLLDGVEPLQQGPGPQHGQLKDEGLRALLRRFAAVPPGANHGLVVLTTRLAVTDIDKWKESAAPVVDLDRLSDDAGAALLKDNGVWGTDADLGDTVRDFGGHALALSLLATFLKDLHGGDVRRRDKIRALLKDADDPRHDHARRVMQSYETEWLAGDPVLHAIMRLVGLFDRPASGACLGALREPPAIDGLTEEIVGLDAERWRRGVAQLRKARLLAPEDPLDTDSLDAHALVREWFGERLQAENADAWRAAHGRLYDFLRDNTEEGDTPSLADLAPLYQAIPHGCRAGRHQEALDDIYADRICRRLPDGTIEFYASKKLGALSSDLAAMSWFFDKPFETPNATLREAVKSWVLSCAAFNLRGQGRVTEALPAMRSGSRQYETEEAWKSSAIAASNLSQAELLTGDLAGAIDSAARSIDFADKSGDVFQMMSKRTTRADALHAAGRLQKAEELLAEAERQQQELDSDHPFLYSLQGYQYCDLFIGQGDWAAARDRAHQTLEIARANNWLLDIALDTLTLGRAHTGLVLETIAAQISSSIGRDDADLARRRLDEAVDGLRRAGQRQYIPPGLLGRAAFRRAAGDWEGAERDLEEVEEIAEPGPMRLFLCDLALERTRLACARIKAFAPLNGLLDDGPPEPVAPNAAMIEELKAEAESQLAIARELIAECGYHRRDEERDELAAVLAGARRFADLPPRV